MIKSQIGIYFFYVFMCLSCASTKQMINSHNNGVFIRFGSGYKSDTISLKVNNFQVLKSEILNTKNDNSGNTTSYLRIHNDSVYYFSNGSLKFRLFLKETYDDKIILEPIINNRPYSFTMYFKNGKYLIIDKHQYYYNVYFNQYKKMQELY